MHTFPSFYLGLICLLGMSLFSCRTSQVPYLNYVATQQQLATAEDLLEQDKLQQATKLLYQTPGEVHTEWKKNRLLAESYQRQQLSDSAKHYLQQGILEGDLWLADVLYWQAQKPDSQKVVPYPGETAWKIFKQYYPLIHNQEAFWKAQIQALPFDPQERWKWKQNLDIEENRNSLLSEGWPAIKKIGLISPEEGGAIWLILKTPEGQILSDLSAALLTATKKEQERMEIALLGMIHVLESFSYYVPEPTMPKVKMIPLPKAIVSHSNKDPDPLPWLISHSLIAYSHHLATVLPIGITYPYYDPNQAPKAKLTLFPYQTEGTNRTSSNSRLKRVARQLKRLGFPPSHIKILAQPLPRSPEADLLGSTIGVRISEIQ